jgi:hypothetical protein
MKDTYNSVPEEVQNINTEMSLANSRRSVEEQERPDQRTEILRYMEGRGVLKMDGENIVINRVKFNRSWQRDRGWGSVRYSVLELANALKDLRGFEETDTETEDYTEGRMEPRPIMSFPNSMQDLITDYPERSQNSVLNFWELGSTNYWTNKMVLDSGEEVTIGEVFVASELLGRFKAKRDKDGVLEIYDEKQGAIANSAAASSKISVKRIQASLWVQ